MSWSCLWAVCACLLVGVGAEETCDAQREEMENTICSLCAQRVDSRLKDMGKWFLMLIVGISFVLCMFCLLFVVFVWLIVVFFFSLLLYLKCWNCNMIYNSRKPPYHNQNLFPAKLFNRSTLVNERKQNSYNFSFRSFLIKFKNDLFSTNINYPYRFLNIWNTVFKLELKVVTLKKR